MNYKRTTVSFGSTGVQTACTTTFQPVACRITVGSKLNATDSANHLSMGNTNGTTQSYHSTFSDSSAAQTKSGTNKLVSHYERVSGVLTEVLAATIDSFTATEVKINVTTANSSYQMHVEVWG